MELIFDDAELVLYKSGELEVLPETCSGSFSYEAHGMYVSYFFFRNVSKLNIYTTRKHYRSLKSSR
jgi:hypothetical protein